MRALVEVCLFMVLAFGLHILIWPSGDTGAAEAAGDGGAELLTLAASSASVQQMVRKWETPPEAAPLQQAALAPPPLPELTQPPAQPDQSPALPTAQRPAPVSLPEMPKTPTVATAPAVPRPPEPPAKPKPAPAPEKQITQPKPAPPAKPETPAAQPVQKPSKASAASTAQRAAGTGGQKAKGEAGRAKTATLSKSKEKSLIASWGASVRARIAKRVPRGVGKGTAYVRITVSASGALLGVKLHKSSGSAQIDKAALSAVQRAGKFPGAPRGLGRSQVTFTLPISSR